MGAWSSPHSPLMDLHPDPGLKAPGGARGTSGTGGHFVMLLVWVAPRGSPPCRMGPACSWDAGKCLCGYLVIFLGQGVPCCCCLLVTWGFEAVLGGWWARGWCLCLRPCHPIQCIAVLVTAHEGVLAGAKLQGKVCPEGLLPRFPHLYKESNSPAVPTSSGAEGLGLVPSTPAHHPRTESHLWHLGMTHASRLTAAHILQFGLG